VGASWWERLLLIQRRGEKGEILPTREGPVLPQTFTGLKKGIFWAGEKKT